MRNSEGTPPPGDQPVAERAHLWAVGALVGALAGPARPADPEVAAYVRQLIDAHKAAAREARRIGAFCEHCDRPTNGRLTYCCWSCPGRYSGQGSGHTVICDQRAGLL